MTERLSVIYDLEEIHSWTGTYSPFEIAKHLDFTIEYTDALPEGQLGLTVPELSVIFLACSLKDSRCAYFICAHELVHGTEHDGIQAFYNCSERAKGRIEQEADSGAIYILCNFYWESFPELSRPELNVFHIAKYFELDDCFHYHIEDWLEVINEGTT